jgi:hypothetical protein
MHPNPLQILHDSKPAGLNSRLQIIFMKTLKTRPDAVASNKQSSDRGATRGSCACHPWNRRSLACTLLTVMWCDVILWCVSLDKAWHSVRNLTGVPAACQPHVIVPYLTGEATSEQWSQCRAATTTTKHISFLTSLFCLTKVGDTILEHLKCSTLYWLGPYLYQRRERYWMYSHPKMYGTSFS